jgi:hypothetical protein
LTDLHSINKKQLKLHSYIPPAVKNYELMSDEELWEGKGGTLIVDTESYINYFLIAFKCIKTGKIIQLEAPFNERKLSWIMHNYWTVGFNSLKYDLAMIWSSYVNQDTQRLQNVSWSLVQGTWVSQVAQEHGFKIFKTNHIDLIEVCPLKGSLKLYGARLHSPRIQDLPFDPLSELTEEEKIIVRDVDLSISYNDIL